MRGERRLVGLVVFGLVAGALGLAPAAAVGAGRDSKAVVWHLHWTRFSDPGYGSWQRGPWVFVLENFSSGEGVLFNLTAGTNTRLAPPAEECAGVVDGTVRIGGGWLMFDCTTSTNGSGYPTIEELYSLNHRTWRTFDSSVAEEHGCGTQYYCSMSAVAIGAHWIQFSTIDGGIPTSPSWMGWENLDTHAWKQTGYDEERIPGLGPRTMLDLNSPSLLARVCAPVRLPFQGRLIGTPQGLRSPIEMFGRFAIVGDPYPWYFPSYARRNYTYLRRCGRHHRRTLSDRQATSTASNGRVLIWGTNTNQLAGMYLASGQRFVSSLASPAPDGAQLEIAPHDAIQLSSSGLWEAPLPAPLS